MLITTFSPFVPPLLLPPPLVVFSLGIILFAWVGGPVSTIWPLWRTYVWAPLIPPLVYLVVNLAYPQPTGRILQVVLLHTFIILQVSTSACTWRKSEAQTYTERILRDMYSY